MLTIIKSLQMIGAYLSKVCNEEHKVAGIQLTIDNSVRDYHRSDE